MKKFWKINNQIGMNEAEILIYGPISDETWWGDEVTPKEFAKDLAGLDNKNVCVRINSAGGDVFAAHAIYNQLCTYSGTVTVRIDGLAASAATIIAMAGQRVIMPTNALMMIHNPMIGLFGYYNATDFAKMTQDLETVKGSIIAVYKRKSNLSDDELAEIMDKETYLSPKEALEYGFADEIEGDAAMTIDGNFLIVNSIKHDLSKIKNVEQIRKKVQEENEVDILNELRKILNAQNAVPPQDGTEQAVKAERQRILDLDALSDGNPAIKDIVDEAKQSGKTADEIKPYVDTIKKHTKTQEDESSKLLNKLMDLVKDNKNSGADGIGASGDEKDDERQEYANATNEMAKLINMKNGVKTNG